MTYLSDHGSPTVICPNKIGCNGNAPAYIESDIDQACLSWPAVGKHVSFDGRLLHAAPVKDSQKRVRTTFLVNIWLNHKPVGKRPFPAVAVDKLSNIEVSASFVTDAPAPSGGGGVGGEGVTPGDGVDNVSFELPAGEPPAKFHMGRTLTECTISLPLPMAALTAAVNDSSGGERAGEGSGKGDGDGGFGFVGGSKSVVFGSRRGSIEWHDGSAKDIGAVGVPPAPGAKEAEAVPPAKRQRTAAPDGPVDGAGGGGNQ